MSTQTQKITIVAPAQPESGSASAENSADKIAMITTIATDITSSISCLKVVLESINKVRKEQSTIKTIRDEVWEDVMQQCTNTIHGFMNGMMKQKKAVQAVSENNFIFFYARAVAFGLRMSKVDIDKLKRESNTMTLPYTCGMDRYPKYSMVESDFGIKRDLVYATGMEPVDSIMHSIAGVSIHLDPRSVEAFYRSYIPFEAMLSCISTFISSGCIPRIMGRDFISTITYIYYHVITLFQQYCDIYCASSGTPNPFAVCDVRVLDFIRGESTRYYQICSNYYERIDPASTRIDRIFSGNEAVDSSIVTDMIRRMTGAEISPENLENVLSKMGANGTIDKLRSTIGV